MVGENIVNIGSLRRFRMRERRSLIIDYPEICKEIFAKLP